DAERAGAAVLDDEEEIGGTKPRASAQEGAEREQALADERQSDRESRCPPEGTGANARQPWRPRVVAAGLPFGYGLRQRDQPLDAVWEPGAVRVDVRLGRLAERVENERDESRVPLGDPTGVERKVMDGARAQFAECVGRFGQSAFTQPGAGDFEHDCVWSIAPDGQRRSSHPRGG